MNVSDVPGIRVRRDAEEERFVRFFGLVQAQAGNEGSVFFMDSGDGNEFATSDMEGEDLTGWLVPKGEAGEFEALWRRRQERLSPHFDGSHCFAEWRKRGADVTVKFTRY